MSPPQNKGRNTAVEPIRSEKAIKAISRMLKSEYCKRNYLLFTLGINTGLRVVDLLKITLDEVRGLSKGQTFTIKESKTKKQNTITINGPIERALNLYLPQRENDPSTYPLFQNNMEPGKPICTNTVQKFMKKWTESAGLKGRYGAHTLRKTFGYHQRIKYGTGFELLCKRFNHSSPRITMCYLGIQDSEVHEILLNSIG
jgi:integrase